MKNAVVHSIHDVLPADADDKEDSISLKNIKKDKAQWNLEKEVLCFQFDGIKKTIWLAAENITLISLMKTSVGMSSLRQQNSIIFEHTESQWIFLIHTPPLHSECVSKLSTGIPCVQK